MNALVAAFAAGVHLATKTLYPKIERMEKQILLPRI